MVHLLTEVFNNLRSGRTEPLLLSLLVKPVTSIITEIFTVRFIYHIFVLNIQFYAVFLFAFLLSFCFLVIIHGFIPAVSFCTTFFLFILLLKTNLVLFRFFFLLILFVRFSLRHWCGGIPSSSYISYYYFSLSWIILLKWKLNALHDNDSTIPVRLTGVIFEVLKMASH